MISLLTTISIINIILIIEAISDRSKIKKLESRLKKLENNGL